MPNPWFRAYAEFASDPKVQIMTEAMQRRLHMLMCLRCSETLETLHETELAFALRISHTELAETKTVFLAKGFIDEHWNLLNWDKRQYVSDSSTERVRAHRDKKKATTLFDETDEKRFSNAPDKIRTDTEAEAEEIKTETTSPALRVYKAYPHKIGKGAAIKSIEKALDILRKRNEPDPEKFLLLRIQGWIDKREKDRAAGKFVPEYPNPSTWFNQGRYDDEGNFPKPKIERTPLTEEEAEASWEKAFAQMGMGRPNA